MLLVFIKNYGNICRHWITASIKDKKWGMKSQEPGASFGLNKE